MHIGVQPQHSDTAGQQSQQSQREKAHLQIKQTPHVALHDLHAAAQELLCRIIRKIQHQVIALGEQQGDYGAGNQGGGKQQHCGHEPAYAFGLQKHAVTELKGHSTYQGCQDKKAGQGQTLIELAFEAVKKLADIAAAPTGHVQEKQGIAYRKNVGEQGGNSAKQHRYQQAHHNIYLKDELCHIDCVTDGGGEDSPDHIADEQDQDGRAIAAVQQILGAGF